MFPRLLAIAEVLWSFPLNRDYKEFYGRVQNHYSRLDDLGVMYGPEQGSVKILNKNVLALNLMEIEILKGQSNLEVYYTTDGSVPTTSSKHYTKPFRIGETTLVRAAGFRERKLVGSVYSQKFVLSKSTGKSMRLSHQPADKYLGGGTICFNRWEEGYREFQ